MKIAVMMDIDIPELPSGISTKTQATGLALQKAIDALGNASADDTGKGLFRDEHGNPCGTWEVTELPGHEPKAP